MPFPVATPTSIPPLFPAGATVGSNYSGTFIPEIWSGKLIEKFYNATVLAAISNTDYEGEIKDQGDKVNIRSKPTITILPYKADGAMAIERPQGNLTTLTIDQAYYFNLALDNVIEIQSDLNLMSMWGDDAGQQMKIVIDTLVLKGILGQASPFNRGLLAGKQSGVINLGVSGTPLLTVARNATAGQVEIIDVILRLGQALDEQNIPENGRWVVLPTWAATQIKMSELRQVYLSGDSVSMLRNGRLGMIDRFTIYASNLLPQGVLGGMLPGENVIYAGTAHGLTFASQVSRVRTIESEISFARLLSGLQVFGYKVLDGIAIAQAIVTH